MLVMNTDGKTISKIPFCNDEGCMYDSKGEFHEGLLAVKRQTREGMYWGYMDKKGKMVIPAQFDKALNFQDGRAVVVTSNGKVAIIKNPLKGNEIR